MKNTLEGSQLFPYIAWTAVILFALFTYSLISSIKESTAYLAEKTEENKAALDTFITVKKTQGHTEIPSTNTLKTRQ